MRKSSGLMALAVLSLATLAVPARGQSYVTNSAQTITRGDLRLTAYPTGLFGRDDAPDRWGGAGRLGYGITDSFDVEGKGAVFDGFSLVGLDANVRLLKGGVDMSASLGAHKALIRDAHDSTAVDLSWLVGGRVAPSLRLSGGVSLSFESLDDVPNSSFTRAYVVPAVEYRVTRNLDFVSQFGVGLNHDSPHYLNVGFALYMPTSESARERR